MVLGFNHNIMYKGEVFHVQTEDSGISNPHIITLLYRGGVIISSQKTSYADILKMENLDVVVEELMKEQHKEMMRRLKAGDFDEKAFSFTPQLIENYEILPPAAEPELRAKVSVVPSSVSTNANSPYLAEQKAAEKSPSGHDKPGTIADIKQTSVDLDEAVLSFFSPREK